MKKIYLGALSLLFAGSLMAQTTITNHFEGALTDINNPQIGYFAWSGGNGYVSGNNSYGDKAIVQLFDADYGITNSGTIEGLKVYIAHKTESGNPVDITLGIWENNSGTPGNLIGSETVTLSSIDTSSAGLNPITDGTALQGVYNVSVTFGTPLTIPANESFFAGITLPTATEAAAGDTLVVITTAGTFTFADAATHAGSINATDGIDYYGANGVTSSNGIFPDVTISTVSIEENIENSDLFSVYPNPTTSNLTFDFAGANFVNAINIMGINGSLVKNVAVNGSDQINVNVADLAKGFYVYQIVDNDGQVVKTAKFVKQ